MTLVSAATFRSAAMAAGSLALFASCSPRRPGQSAIADSGSPHLFAWTTDADSTDLNFLAVPDARMGSRV